MSLREYLIIKEVIVQHSWGQAQRDKNIWQELGRTSFLHGAEWDLTE